MRKVIALLLALSALPAIAAEPFARSAIEKTDTIVPGQQLRLTVDVFAPCFFTSPPDLPLFEMEDALVTLPEERAQNLVETIDGVQYAGIRRQYAIVPERAGSFSIPPISINFAYSADGAPTRGTVKSPTRTPHPLYFRRKMSKSPSLSTRALLNSGKVMPSSERSLSPQNRRRQCSCPQWIPVRRPD